MITLIADVGIPLYKQATEISLIKLAAFMI